MFSITTPIPEFELLKKSPKLLYGMGDVTLLQTPMISIVGTRKPIAYTKDATLKLARAFSAIGYTIVSGAAMGVDAVAHQGAFPRTIAVMANSLDILYPNINSALITRICQNGLALSEYPVSTPATKYSFVVRNRLVVALGEALIITQADLDSGTMRSAEIAKELGKKIFVLPHRLGESLGTAKLLEEGDARPIYDIDRFVALFGAYAERDDEEALFLQKIPTLQEALARFGDALYEMELEGKIEIKNLRVYPC